MVHFHRKLSSFLHFFLYQPKDNKQNKTMLIKAKNIVKACNIAKKTRNISYLQEISSNYNLTEEQKLIKDTAEDFANEEFLPYAKEWDKKKIFPYDQLVKGAELGFGGLYVEEEYGGTNLPRTEAAIVFEELAKGCTSTTAYLTLHNMVGWILNTFGTDEQKQRYLPKLVTMEHCGSYCLTEADSGSDAASLKTKAVPSELDPDTFIVNGSKSFISGGGTSDLYLVICRTPRGFSVLAIEKNMPGVSFGLPEEKLGWNSQSTTTVNFDDVAVPKANLIGKEGQGFKIAMQALQGTRVNMAAASIGAGQACFDIARDYVKERKQFGRPIAAFQNTQFKVSEMATKLYLARRAVHEAAKILDEGKFKEGNVICAMAKSVASDAGFEVCNSAMQLLGGYGYLSDFPIERYLRDVRVHQILGGTNEIMQVLISRDILN
eukprot:maker-scaffold_1-snap-gene-8.1-mRNA-1 protein AED:0.25 eAED:0.25 QI:38/1/1/1/1/1/3/84/433